MFDYTYIDFDYSYLLYTVFHIFYALVATALAILLFWKILVLYNVWGLPEHTKNTFEEILKIIFFLFLVYLLDYLTKNFIDFIFDLFTNNYYY